MKRVALYVLCAGMSLGYVVSCQSESSVPQAPLSNNPNAPHLLREPELTTFASLVTTADLLEFFHGTGPFTSFAPSNNAFIKFNKRTLEQLKKPENRDQLIDLINYHVVLGKYMSHNLKAGKKTTVNGKEITIRSEDGVIWINNAKVTKADLVGPNGVTYIIDTVLVP